MNHVPLKLSVAEAAEQIKKSLVTKGFTLFCDVDHQANAESVGLDMPASRMLAFGNPLAGTKLMQTDLFISLDLPIRLALVDNEGTTLMVHQTTEDYCQSYQVAGHPVLEKIESLFTTLAKELDA